MKKRMISTKDLKEGMIIADTVLSPSGKVLLGKNIVVSPRTISLLAMWNVNLVYIEANDSEPSAPEQPAAPATAAASQAPAEAEPSQLFLQFFNQYDALTRKATQSFDFVRDNKKVPLQGMKDTAFGIYSTVLTSGPALMDYLLVSDHNLADQLTRHSVMVAFISSVIGRQMKLAEADIHTLVLAGLLHDIGKFVIPKEEDRNPLSHVISGAKLLRNVDGLPQEVILSVLQHHECMDGTGFPMAKEADKIHPFARIVAIADIFHSGAYNGEHVNPFPVLERIAENQYSQLDPAVCRPFLSKIRDSLINSPVLLSNGTVAKVVFFNGDRFASPVVKTDAGVVIDLAADSGVSIRHIATQEFLSTIP
ncbi:MAG: HD domain-containing protein [Sporomusaceae bacterium]|nr:HD domain-containing protein [Sporomusaceae bacterium]